jgi:hypothetical protein
MKEADIGGMVMASIQHQSLTALFCSCLTLSLLAPLATLVHAQPKFSLSERYPGPWVEVTQPIRDILDRNEVLECGQAVARQSSKDPGEHPLYCTRDEKQWTRWHVWPASHKLSGPDKIFSSIPLPDSY